MEGLNLESEQVFGDFKIATGVCILQWCVCVCVWVCVCVCLGWVVRDVLDGKDPL